MSFTFPTLIHVYFSHINIWANKHENWNDKNCDVVHEFPVPVILCIFLNIKKW